MELMQIAQSYTLAKIGSRKLYMNICTRIKLCAMGCVNAHIAALTAPQSYDSGVVKTSVIGRGKFRNL